MKTREQIHKYVKKWRKILRLEHWRLRVCVRDTTPPTDKDPSKASCEAWPEYREANLTFTLDLIEAEPTDLEELVAHEMCHCRSWPLTQVADEFAKQHEGLKEWARIATETVTTDFADLMYAVVKSHS
jgi:hypothetical protein